jgi:hypothetical protein
MNTVLVRTGLPTSRHSLVVTIPSPLTHGSSSSLSHATPQRDERQAARLAGFVTLAQTRRRHQAESSSFAYGLVTCLQLLPTSPRDDAVTIGFRAGERMPGEDSHLPERVRLWAHASARFARADL